MIFHISDTLACILGMDASSVGCEIAAHTVSHPSLHGADTMKIKAEVAGMIAHSIKMGIPVGEIVGFRAPYLEGATPVLREVLHESGMLYDRYRYVCDSIALATTHTTATLPHAAH